MQKNNKGFFLAETIVIIALVTTVMAFVYPNVSKLYENYKLQVKYYDQPEDIYVLKAVNDYIMELVDGSMDNPYKDKTVSTESPCSTSGELGGKIIDKLEKIEKFNSDDDFYTVVPSGTKLNTLYLTSYMASPDSDDYNFNRYLKRMKKTTNDKPAYRLIGIFIDGSKTRYASIKVENPNPNRNCNL